MDKKQLEWLEADLSVVPRNRLIVLAMHAPIKTVDSDIPDNGITINNRKELVNLLSGFENVFAIAGHIHGTQHVYFLREAL